MSPKKLNYARNRTKFLAERLAETGPWDEDVNSRRKNANNSNSLKEQQGSEEQIAESFPQMEISANSRKSSFDAGETSNPTTANRALQHVFSKGKTENQVALFLKAGRSNGNASKLESSSFSELHCDGGDGQVERC